MASTEAEIPLVVPDTRIQNNEPLVADTEDKQAMTVVNDGCGPGEQQFTYQDHRRPQLDVDKVVAIDSWILGGVMDLEAETETCMNTKVSEGVIPSVEGEETCHSLSEEPVFGALARSIGDDSFHLGSLPRGALNIDYYSIKEADSGSSDATGSEDKHNPMQKCTSVDMWPFEWHASKEGNRLTGAAQEVDGLQTEHHNFSSAGSPGLPDEAQLVHQHQHQSQHSRHASVSEDSSWSADIQQMLSLPFEGYPWQENESVLAMLPRAQDLEEYIQLYFLHFHEARLRWWSHPRIGSSISCC
ncbi:hypothetical protein LTR47_009909 [Exophiala xenobiotica]|nr:hypothetical protein LTR47_009909 [Exophiala xenobiotica]KAK5243934.1 hypothetical protein LTS06_010410 [Exophiala xenobiotica]KAK5282182.1 hypothetical protein LTR40_003664 [Exophiala xenobiotica]KAK5347935.1 hypothetical protein LTR61_008187 [Exophiala xenobiotica]KAK5361456.1 hypothetical protein LTS03_010409 [Exophiala xenobiotica]